MVFIGSENEQEEQFNYPDKCAVCGQKCRYFHYEARCCEGCKHFFRRSVSTLKQYTCVKNSIKCNITRGKGAKCKKCRLDKCILVGMDARGVGSQKFGVEEMLEYVDKRRRELAKGRKCQMQKQDSAETVITSNEEEENDRDDTILSPIVDAVQDARRILEYLVGVERKVRRIRDSRTKVPEMFYDNCDSFEQIFCRQYNLISFADQFSTELPVPLRRIELTTLEQRQITERPPYLAMDLLFTFECAKTLPFFEMLDTPDKASLLSNIAMPLMVLSNGYYSWQQNSDTFSTPMGFAPMALFGAAQEYRENKVAMKMAQRVFCEAMVPFIRAMLSIEEFVLLRAIIYSHMVSSGLSEKAQQILLREAGKYSALLMNLLQCQLGPLSGARRYAELLSLMEFCFNSGAQHRQWLTFTTTAVEPGHQNAVWRSVQLMPPVLIELCTRGPAQLPELVPI